MPLNTVDAPLTKTINYKKLTKLWLLKLLKSFFKKSNSLILKTNVIILFIKSRFYCIDEIVTEDATGRSVTNVPELTESTTSGGSKFVVIAWMLFWPKDYQRGSLYKSAVGSNPVAGHVFRNFCVAIAVLVALR